MEHCKWSFVCGALYVGLCSTSMNFRNNEVGRTSCVAMVGEI